ncbi:MAG: type IV pilin protein [Deltaproteobacteria bacterium]
MFRRGFTLLELMIVIIIIGVLATVGIMQYQSTIEKSRGAEARTVIGSMRQLCAAKWMETQDTGSCTPDVMRLGTDIPNGTSTTCGAAGTVGGKFWFNYSVSTAAKPNGLTFTANRCRTNGKYPSATADGTISLAVDFVNGTDNWTSATY